MKANILLAIMLVASLHVMAQREVRGAEGKSRPAISEVVDDLNAKQKHKIDNITKESKERVDALRRQQQAVRDSITMMLDREGDQSQLLFPLFDREAKLHAAISREMYTTKLRMDEVLTKEQRDKLRKAYSKDRNPRRR